MQLIKELCTTIKKETGNKDHVYFSTIFIYWTDFEFKETKIKTLLRIKNDSSLQECIYIDTNNKVVYKGWKNFINNNKLPKCWLCLPQNGEYSTGSIGLNIVFEKSHSCSITSQIYDLASNMALPAGTSGTIVMAGSYLTYPILGAFIGGAITLCSVLYNMALPKNMNDVIHVETVLVSRFIKVTAYEFALKMKDFLSWHEEASSHSNNITKKSSLGDIIYFANNLSQKTLRLFMDVTELLKNDRDLFNQRLRSALLYYFHIFVEDDSVLNTVTDHLTELLNEQLMRSPQTDRKTIFPLQACNTMESIVEKLTIRGFGKVSLEE